VVSLNPSLTAILVAIGAQHTLVGVDAFSARQEPRVAQLPLVGGLFSPSLEAVVALQPDLVVLVPSVEQRDFRRRLEGLGVKVSVFENIRFEEVLENIERLGVLTGRRAAARERVEAVRRSRAAVSRASARVGGPGGGPRTVVVLQRDPLFIVGSHNFIAEMLVSVRAANLGREFGEPYPRVASEWLVAAAPEVVIDLSPPGEDARGFWDRWRGIPAVASERVYYLDAATISLPGPHLDRSLELLGRSIYGEAFERALAAELRNVAGLAQ
jgi:iron complex transport system substrate-binding protein